MKLVKIQAELPDTAGFGDPVHVQGASLRFRGKDRLAESTGRFKLDIASRAMLYILSGEGYIKWARGETPFSAGDVFFAEETGETELCGACTFFMTQQ